MYGIKTPNDWKVLSCHQGKKFITLEISLDLLKIFLGYKALLVILVFLEENYWRPF